MFIILNCCRIWPYKSNEFHLLTCTSKVAEKEIFVGELHIVNNDLAWCIRVADKCKQAGSCAWRLETWTFIKK